MNRFGDAAPEKQARPRGQGHASVGLSSGLERTERLLQPWRPMRPRVLVVAEQDDWTLSFRSLSLRRDFAPGPVTLDWFRGSAESESNPWLRRSTSVCIWQWGTLSAEQIQLGIDRGRVLSPHGIHFVAAPRWRAIERLHWTRLGATATLQNPEDLWSYRRLVRWALQRVDTI